MVTLSEIRGRVDTIFDARPAELAPWPNPRPSGDPYDDAYSRVTNPQRWRIVTARADAWIEAITSLGLATVTPEPEFGWTETSNERVRGARFNRTDLVVPLAPGALALTVARIGLEETPETGVVLGVGIPARLHLDADCNCDACDSGSQDALDQLDEHITDVITGAYRSLEKGSQSITVGEQRRHGRGMNGRELERALRNPRGWSELTGTPWFG